MFYNHKHEETSQASDGNTGLFWQLRGLLVEKVAGVQELHPVHLTPSWELDSLANLAND